MTEEGKERVKAAAAAGVGAGVGGVGGGTAGVLELAALGTVTEVSAGLAIAAGAVAGAAVFLAGWGLYRFLKKPKSKGETDPGLPSKSHNAPDAPNA